MKSTKTTALAIVALLLSFSAVAAGKQNSPIEEAKKAIKEILKDPASAQFKDVRVIDGNVCGKYNAKNSYGGYGEWDNFLYLGKSKKLVNLELMQIEAEIALISERQKNTDKSLFNDKMAKIDEKYKVIKQIETCAVE
jgi:hypothetical protein